MGLIPYLDNYSFDEVYALFTNGIEKTVEEFISSGADINTAMGRTHYEYDPSEPIKEHQTFCEIVVFLELIRIAVKKEQTDISKEFKRMLFKRYKLENLNQAVEKVIKISKSKYIEKDLTYRLKQINID